MDETQNVRNGCEHLFHCASSLPKTYALLVLCSQVLRRKERECEHEMERLAREKIAAQQRLAALKREVSVRATVRPRSIGTLTSARALRSWYTRV